MKTLAAQFDGSMPSRYMDPHRIMDEVQTLVALLAYAQPQGQDSLAVQQDRAENLLKEFSSLGGIFHASSTALLQHDVTYEEIGLFKTVLAAQLHMLENTIKRGTQITSWAQLEDYLKISIADHDTERFKVLFLDRKNILIKDETMGAGTVDHTPVYPREVAKRALELNASAIILVHNHPSGDTTPSSADIQMTQKIVNACSALDITVHDHVIVGRGNSKVRSFIKDGMMPLPQ